MMNLDPAKVISLTKDVKGVKWTLRVSIPLPPACEAGALPSELNAHKIVIFPLRIFDIYYFHHISTRHDMQFQSSNGFSFTNLYMCILDTKQE